MKAFGALLIALVACHAGALKVGTSDSTLMREILGMLQTRYDSLELEARRAKTTWATAKCECDDNKERLARDIKTKSEEIAEAEADKEKARASARVASQDVADAKASENKLTAALNAATVERGDQLAAFNEKKAELQGLIGQLDGAIQSLADSIAFVQTKGFAEGGKYQHKGQWFDATRTLLADIMPMMEHKDAQATRSFIQQREPHKGAITQVSETLQGLRKQFDMQLTDETDTEDARLKAFEKYRDETQSMIEKQQDTQRLARLELTSTDARVVAADGIIDYGGLDGLKASLVQEEEDCANTEKQYNELSALRAQEMSAVHEAERFLNTDESKDLFRALDGHASRTKKEMTEGVESEAVKDFSFIQIHSSRHRIVNATASNAYGRLEEVIKVLERQIETLQNKTEEENQEKATCEETRTNSTNDVEENGRVKLRLETDLGVEREDLANAETSVDTTTDTLETLKRSQEAFTENFKQRTAEYEASVRDGKAALELLTKVVKVMNKFYDAGVRSGHNENYSDKEQQHGNGGILGLLEELMTTIRSNMQTEETDQTEAKTAYDRMVENFTTAESTASSELATFSEAVASHKKEIASLEKRLEDNAVELNALNSAYAEVFPRCNFLFVNAESRAGHRSTEITGLNNAIEALRSSSGGR